jgi:hypothetical protein
MMSAPRSVDHVDVAAYVLGILDEPEDAAFSQHLAQCARCRAELRDLADLPPLLDQLKPLPRTRKRSKQPAVPSKEVLGRALDQITSERRQRRRTTWLAAAAAAVLLVSIPVVVWQAGRGNDGPTAGPPVAASAPSSTTTETTTTTTGDVAGAGSWTGSNADTGVKASINLVPVSWGTQVTLELRGITGPIQCQLVAVSKQGLRQVVTSWGVPAAGFGVPGSPAPLVVSGGVGFVQGDIIRFEVRREGGPDLLHVTP